ncbi:P-loop containing nucleoside triphosphate hydrolase protein [Naematelia encephala]|uniref:ATP-dependent RNA helicase n=1 Tax=Naematelia encephala TaxID=71784 RepID=A0A1Y2AZM9_9TREE|nr:P-loop containing nucleoside triphosphate hydrolase protein [Naematelia encephala]
MGEKRKHITFEEPAPAAGPSHIHPSRAGIVPQEPAAKKSKSKTAAKQRYLHKKARRHRVLVKARKASAPKNKSYQPNGSSVANSETDTEDSGSQVEEPRIDRETNAEAGPSTLVRGPVIPAEEPAVPSKEKNKRKIKETKTVEAVVGEEDSEAERARRKLEKRKKREERDRTAKRERKAAERAKKEKQAKAEAPPLLGPESGDVERIPDATADRLEDIAESAEENEDEAGSESEDLIPPRPQSPPPPTLEAFPLPTSAPAPDPKILSRQGLPAGLEDAEFIDQDLRLAVDQLQGLSDDMKSKLKKLGIEEFFAVQAALLPHLLPLRLTPFPFGKPNDHLVSAPTGSGKTLAYSIPLIEILRQRVIPRLRALIVLPTRDLVGQVRETLEMLAKGTGLTIGSISGQHSIAREQEMIVADLKSKLLGGSSKVDILIATPGRLIDHLAQTPNFSLQHLRFLIIDEADRLLNQSFHDWLAKVLSNVVPPSEPIQLPEGFVRDKQDHIAQAWMEYFGLANLDWRGHEEYPLPCQKLLFSATLTRDPSSIASLHLRNPKYHIVQSSSSVPDAAAVGESFALPSTLTERMVILPPAVKPLNLIHLIHHEAYRVRGLIFVKSVESVGRLVHLLEYFEEAWTGDKVVVKGYTSEMKAGERKKLLDDFAAGRVDLLVCSDLIARGMDLPTVSHVISYDIPLDMRKYVHRVGRTARAGRQGTAWSLVEKQEAIHWKSMLKGANHEKSVKKVKIKDDELKEYKEAYENAMKRLKTLYAKDY